MGRLALHSARPGGMMVAPPPVRSEEALQGHTDLEPSDADMVKTGADLMRATVALVKICILQRVHWSIENPLTSVLWLMPEMY